MKTCVIIPTYNEAKSIKEVVKSVAAQGFPVVVIDDGSRDQTAESAEDGGAVVLRNKANQGKGASLRRGFHYCLSHEYDAVITMDGDGQHLPSDIPYFIRLGQYSKSSILIGNRMQKNNRMPKIRYITNLFMSWLISHLTGQTVPDSQCGFRFIKKDVLLAIRLTTVRYETESELLMEGARKGFKIESVPIQTIYQHERSYINPLIDTIRFLRLLFRKLWEYYA